MRSGKTTPILREHNQHPLKTICIVEDLSEIRRSLVQKVQSMPEVRFMEQFSNAEDALKMLPSLAPDLVIMDIGLPKMSGVDCMARLKKAGHTMDFIMFTVFDSDEDLFPALQIGAAGYILKGEGASGVANAIQVWLQGGAPMSPSIAKKVIASFQKAKLSPKPEFVGLTPRESEILELISKGLLNKEIATRLECAEATIKQHNVKIYRKLSVNSRAEAMLKYLESKTEA